MTDNSSSEKAFSILELLISSLISLTVLTLLAPSIKAAHNFLLTAFEENHEGYQNLKLEA